MEKGKFFACLLGFLMIFGAGCGGQSAGTDNPTPEKPPVEEPPTEEPPVEEPPKEATYCNVEPIE